ncbi:hypothetical protein E5358_08565 [Palleniella muris]|uniref:Uncharacterized protein n=1 Tax=Palleniella muris TaxID=3038145 RepID=A0AC61QPZ1_9BACT|nr:acyltransferase family protein [Palleniella muris]TGX82101.1 hypothetical protein E5358_08565 [Palleniella muris]
MVKEISVSKRIVWVDICKGLGILMVMIVHTGVSSLSTQLNSWMLSFVMPLFYMLSGMMFNPDKYDTFSKYFNRRFQTLVLPFLVLNTTLFCLAKLINLSNVQPHWTELFTGVLAMYFIRALFVSEIWYYLLQRFVERKSVRLLVVVMAIIFCDVLRGVIPEYIGDTRNEAIGVVLPSMPLLYYAIGQLFRTKIISLDIDSLKLSVILFIMLISIGASLILIPICKSYLYILPAGTGIITIVSCSMLLSRYLKDGLVNTVTYIGTNTLIVVAFHQIIYNGMKVFTQYWHLTKTVDALIRIGVMFIVLVIIIEGVNKYLPWVVGKFKY